MGFSPQSFTATIGSGLVVNNAATDNDANFFGELDKTDAPLTLGVNAKLSKSVGVDLQYIDFGEVKFDGLFAGTTSVGTVENKGVELSVTGKYPLGNGFNATGKAGALYWDGEENELFGGAPDNESDHGIDPLFGFGVEKELTPHITADFTLTRYFNVFDDNIDAAVFRLRFGL